MKVSSIHSGAIAALAAAASLTSASPVPDQLTFDAAIATEYVSSTPLSLLGSVLSTTRDILTPRLVQSSHDSEPFWALPHYLRWKGVNFFDVTDHLELGTTYSFANVLDAERSASFPLKLSHQKQVQDVHSLLSEKGPRENIAKFSSFRTRYYKSETGRQSQQWLLSKIREYTSSDPDIEVNEFEHPWSQNSILVRIPATNSTAAAENGKVVVGAHQDSVNLILPIFPAPGADDDGSGTVTQLESLRVLLESKWKPKDSDVEFHWYSAEEGGLLGSQAVAQDYAKRGDKVKAMSQFDMTAFVKKDTTPVIGIVTDFVNEKLTNFNRLLVKEYLDVSTVDTELHYAASDHASWTKVGVPSTFSVENKFEDCNLRRIHTTSDVWDHEEYSFEHILRFSRLSSAFIIELAGWGK
ncbi:unnamed protein product [Sympodiomycopsis kandeliae]